MPVTDYSLTQSPGLPGSIASAINSYAVRSKTNTSGGVIAFGRAVVQGTDPQDVILPAADKTGFVGIAVRSYIYEDAETADGAEGYANKKEIDVLVQGEIWVETEVAVAPGDPVYFRIASGTETVVGKFLKTADTISTVDKAVLISQARWISSTTAAGIAKLQINLP
jgi:hypothetical protein